MASLIFGCVGLTSDKQHGEKQWRLCGVNPTSITPAKKSLADAGIVSDFLPGKMDDTVAWPPHLLLCLLEQEEF